MPKLKKKRRTDIAPSVLMMAQNIQHNESKRLMTVLLDSGGSHSLVHSKMLPKGATPLSLPGVRKVDTIVGHGTCMGTDSPLALCSGENQSQ